MSKYGNCVDIDPYSSGDDETIIFTSATGSTLEKLNASSGSKAKAGKAGAKPKIAVKEVSSAIIPLKQIALAKPAKNVIKAWIKQRIELTQMIDEEDSDVEE